MEFEADPNQDGRLRLRRRQLWVPGESEQTAGYAWLMIWSVDGMAGAVSFNVQMGGFRSGCNHLSGSEPTGNQDIGHELVGARRWVECGLAPLGIHVHAYRPWPVSDDHQQESALCPILEERCWSQCVRAEDQEESHELLVRVVQPGGGEFVYERLEAMYREEFAVALSPAALLAARREEGARLAEATARGAERVAGAASLQAFVETEEGFGPSSSFTAQSVMGLAPPFLVDMAHMRGEEGGPEDWRRVLRVSADDGVLRIFTVSGGELTPWELHPDRMVRVRGPL